MEFTCKSKELRSAISIVEKAISAKSSVPILENIFFSLNDGVLTLRGNNLEIGIENTLQLDQPIRNGSVLLKVKTLSSLIAKLDNEFVSFSMDDNQKVNIKSDKINLSILGADIAEYPAFPSIELGQAFSLSVGVLKELISHTIISVSYDETKQFLNGILIKNEAEHIVFVSTDGYRLALKRQPSNAFDNDFKAIVPYKAFNELNRIIQNQNNDELVDIIVSSGQISFKMGDFILISRVIQGQFPDYNQVIPSDASNVFSINRSNFLASAERAAVIANVSNNVVRFLFDSETMTLSANAKGLGDFSETVDIQRISGNEEAKIAFNIKLILDALKIINSENIYISFNNELSPCKLTIEGDDSFCYIIMPIRTTDYQD